MLKTKRVVFTFNERSLDSLQRMKEAVRFRSLGETVRESLQISCAIQEQAKQGFREIIVRNPETNEERVIIIPALTLPKK